MPTGRNTKLLNPPIAYQTHDMLHYHDIILYHAKSLTSVLSQLPILLRPANDLGAVPTKRSRPLEFEEKIRHAKSTCAQICIIAETEMFGVLFCPAGFHHVSTGDPHDWLRHDVFWCMRCAVLLHLRPPTTLRQSHGHPARW